jgi:hypothetical protein
MEKILKYRPSEAYLDRYEQYVVKFWSSFKLELNIIKSFPTNNELSDEQRNNEMGGNIIFRHVGFLPLVKAAVNIHENTYSSFSEIFKMSDSLNLNISSKPWQHVIWNPIVI